MTDRLASLHEPRARALYHYFAMEISSIFLAGETSRRWILAARVSPRFVARFARGSDLKPRSNGYRTVSSRYRTRASTGTSDVTTMTTAIFATSRRKGRRGVEGAIRRSVGEKPACPNEPLARRSSPPPSPPRVSPGHLRAVYTIVGRPRRDCRLSTIVDVYTGDNSSLQSPTRHSAVMTTMMDLRRAMLNFVRSGGHATIHANRACAAAAATTAGVI